NPTNIIPHIPPDPRRRIIIITRPRRVLRTCGRSRCRLRLVARDRIRRRDRHWSTTLTEEHRRDHTEIRSLSELRAVRIAFVSKVETSRPFGAHLPTADRYRLVRLDHPLARVPCGRVTRVNRVQPID